MNKQEIANFILLDTTVLLFDLDNTLLDLEQLNFKSFAYVFRKYFNLNYTFSDYQRFSSGYKLLDGLTNFLEYKKQRYNSALVSDIRREFLDFKISILKKNPKIVKYKPGVKEFLAFLKDKRGNTRNFCGLVTSSALLTTHILLETVGLSQTFKVIVTGDSVVKGKPSPGPYLLTMRVFRVEPENVVIFEDSKPGLEAAKAAGATVVGIYTPGINDEYINMADVVIQDYRELISI